MYRYLKRIIDFSLALVTLIAVAPLFLLLCVLIKLDSKGPIFFVQERVGLHKKTFNMIKFRTMTADTPKYIPTHQLRQPGQYITNIGRILRKTSLDELPQLINILLGQMSLVGPRPVISRERNLIIERDKYGANDVLPGLTGWAQVNGRDTLKAPEKARLDGEYVRNLSFLFDLKCVILTVTCVFNGDGFVEGKTERSKKKKSTRVKKEEVTSRIKLKKRV